MSTFVTTLASAGGMASALRARLPAEPRFPAAWGFGSFQVKVREARDGRNPKTGEMVNIPAKRTPFFKVGKELKEMVDGAATGTSASDSEDELSA